MKSKILHCSVVHSIDDSRIFYKECVSLAKFGYNVSYVAKSSVKENFNNSKYLGVKIQTLKNNNRIINNFILFKIGLKFDVIHFHDPELIIIGLFLKLIGKKVIYDVHENYRQTILYKTSINKNFKRLLVQFIKTFELLANKYFDAIIVVTPSIKNLFTNKNTVLIRNFPVLIPNKKVFDFARDKNVIIYIGSLSEKRGIIEIIKASEYFKNNAELWIAGQWSDNKFQIICENLNEYKNIKYLGHLNHEEISQHLCNSTIGICLLHPTLSYINSYPIKVFEYLQHGLPVLMSNFKTWEKLFHDCCEYVDPLNIKMIAEKINLMLDNKIKLQQMSMKGINLVNHNYNWEIESLALNKIYIDL